MVSVAWRLRLRNDLAASKSCGLGSEVLCLYLKLVNKTFDRTSEGRIDIDMNESQHKLDSFLPPNDATTMMYAICAKDTGDFLGIGGLTTLDSDMGWPTVGYLLNKAAWGKGYATEFLHAFLNMYRELPRSTGSLRVDPRTVAGSEEMEECVVAITVADNYKSQKVLEKCGFKHAMNWQGRRCPMSAFQYFIPSNMS